MIFFWNSDVYLFFTFPHKLAFDKTSDETPAELLVDLNVSFGLSSQVVKDRL